MPVLGLLTRRIRRLPPSCQSTTFGYNPAPIYERLLEGGEEYLAELRPVTAMLVKILGLDFDHDDGAGVKLDAYIRWVQSVLALHEGFLIDLTIGEKGSYLYATFGAPVAHQDAPARAIAAALNLKSPPADLPFRLPIAPRHAQGGPCSIYVHLDAPSKVPDSLYGTR